MSPELLSGSPYAKSVDVWALGILAYEIATFLPPFLHRDRTQVKMMIMTSPIPQINNGYSAQFQDFINKCLDRNVAERWDIAMLCQHDFLKNAADLKVDWVDEMQSHKVIVEQAVKANARRKRKK